MTKKCDVYMGLVDDLPKENAKGNVTHAQETDSLSVNVTIESTYRLTRDEVCQRLCV